MAAADPLGDLAAQIRRDEAQVRQQTSTNTEAEKARHMEEMRQEMDYRRARLEAELTSGDLTNPRKAARERALAVAECFRPTERVPNSTDVTGGKVTDHYDNANPMFKSGGAVQDLEKYFKLCDEKEAQFEALRSEEEKHRLEEDKHHTPQHY